MSTWEKRFYNAILQRGKDYYRKKRVKILDADEFSCQAIVRGSEPYYVQIILNDDYDIKRADCDCQYAQKGNACKHMAAALYATEDKRAPKFKTIKKYVYPFAGTPKFADSYFNIKEITKDFDVDADVFNKANAILTNPQVTIEVETKYDGRYSGKGLLMHCRYYPGEDKTWASAEIVFSADSLLKIYCNCSRQWLSIGSYEYRSYYGRLELCPHLTALFMHAKQYIDTVNPGDATDYRASKFIKQFVKLQNSHKIPAENKRRIILEPKLKYEYDELRLSFKIGVGKLFVLRNLTDFADAVEHRAFMPLGKNEILDFSLDEFDDKSRLYYEFIRSCVEQTKHTSEQIPVYNRNEIKIAASVRLTDAFIDTFFDAFHDEIFRCELSANYTLKTTVKDFTLGETKLKPELEVTKYEVNGNFQGVRLCGELPSLIRGNRYMYYFSENSLCRVINYDVLKPVYSLAEYNMIDCVIGRKNLAEFYRLVLPELKKIINISEPDYEEIDKYLPPEVGFVFYLDSVQGVPECKAYARYDSDEFSLAAMHENEAADFRDNYRENEVKNKVLDYFEIQDLAADTFFCEEDDEKILHILETGVSDLLQYGEVQCTDRFNSLKLRRKVKINVGVSIESELMNLTIQSRDVSSEELIDILNSYKLKKKYHRLRNGDFIKLDSSIAQLDELISALHISAKDILKDNIKLPAYRALYLDKMLEQLDEVYSNRDKLFNKFIKNFKTVTESDFDIPSSLSEIMRGYQQFGHKWLRTISECGFGGILADDMGLGKTLQMISVLLAAKEEGNCGTSIVVCPASLVYNWYEEFKKFAPAMSVCVVAGNAAQRAVYIENYTKYDVLITSYDLLKRDIAEYENKIFKYQILDEAQNIKNHSTAAAKSVKVINAERKFALTGTPIENRLSELWSIFDYLMPGFLYGYETFKKEFETPIVKSQDTKAQNRLKNMISPFVLRRLKGDVLKDLPEKIEEIRYAKFTDKQQEVYDAQVTHMLNMLNDQTEEAFSNGKLQILAELTKIRQICCDPSLLFDDYSGESSKRMACMDLIKSAVEGNHKVLVFSQFTSMLALLENDLKSENLSYYKITGETDKKMRLQMVDKFNTDDTPVFLISLKAGGTGLNLTGADVVIHYDPWWNAAAQNQATDRAHRIGQRNVVSVYKLIAKDTIEEKIQKLQEAKRDLADSIISENTVAFSAMSKEDILKLIQ